MSSQGAEETATEQLRLRDREHSILNTIAQALNGDDAATGFAPTAVPDGSFSEGVGARIEVRVALPNAGARVSEAS